MEIISVYVLIFLVMIFFRGIRLGILTNIQRYHLLLTKVDDEDFYNRYERVSFLKHFITLFLGMKPAKLYDVDDIDILKDIDYY